MPDDSSYLSGFQELAGNARDLVVIVDPVGTIAAVSDSAEALLGYTPASCVGRNMLEFLHPDDVSSAAFLLENAPELNGRTQSVDVRVAHADGSHRPFEVLPRNLLSTRGVVVMTCRDIRDRLELEAERRRTHQMFRNLALTAPVAILQLDASGECLFVNERWSDLSNLPIDNALGFGYLSVIGPEHRREMRERMESGVNAGSAEMRITPASPHLAGQPDTDSADRHSAGHDRTVIARWEMIRNDDGTHGGWVATLDDVTEQKALEARLSHQATHDPLTGLPNRAMLNETLALAISRSRRTDRVTGVLFIDLDQFKIVNDSLGHEVGDHLIVTVAHRLQAVLRPSDSIARFGGDEFVVVVENLADRQEAHAVANRLAEALGAPLELGTGTPYRCSASIGIAVADAFSSPESLLRDADSAMYRAKELGRDRIEVYAEGLQSRALDRLSLEADLRRAIPNNELVVLYQPILDTDSESLYSVEALLRWDHPTRGRLGPDLFIPIAEESGLIVEIGEWVLSTACNELAGHQVRLNVNVSARQLREPTLIEDIERILSDTGFDPHRLVLEITESILMHDAESTVAVLHKLKALGLSLAVDDFGTGYSSLNYLSRFPVDSLKVDRSFVAGLNRSSGDGEIVRAVVSLAHTLGLKATAEGVETEAQLTALRSLRCEHAQGFLFDHPVPITELEERLMSRSAPTS